jgi:hypothetical protein
MKKRIIKYFFPPFLIEVGLFLKKLVLNARRLTLIKKNRGTHNIHIGETVHILANGPSLDFECITKFEHQKIIVMNNFYKGGIDINLDIVACCYGEHSSSPGCSVENINDILKNTRAKSFWLDLSLSDYTFVDVDIPINYVFPAYEPTLFGKRDIMLDKPTLSYQTTAQLAIMVAIHMGFRQIYLHGFDHDFLASKSHLKHFYSEDRDETDYLHSWGYYEAICVMERMWRIYIRIKRLTTRRGITISNCSSRSYLDVFDFVSF